MLGIVHLLRQLIWSHGEYTRTCHNWYETYFAMQPFKGVKLLALVACLGAKELLPIVGYTATCILLVNYGLFCQLTTGHVVSIPTM